MEKVARKEKYFPCENENENESELSSDWKCGEKLSSSVRWTESIKIYFIRLIGINGHSQIL